MKGGGSGKSLNKERSDGVIASLPLVCVVGKMQARCIILFQ